MFSIKVIFLDFDGVLNCEKYIRRCGQQGVVIDPTRMVLLKEIVDQTDAKIVLSTSWREHWSKQTVMCDSVGEQITEIFDRYGLQIWDKTPNLHRKREQEIQHWLEEHTDVSHFVVLDDMFLEADFLKDHFIKTSNYRNGLEETDVQRAIAILRGVL